jgi:MoxR-like ATPase
VRATRPLTEGGHSAIAPLLRSSAGPRAGQALVLAAKARATLRGRAYVALDDIRSLVKPVLRRQDPGSKPMPRALTVTASSIASWNKSNCPPRPQNKNRR